VTSKKPPLESSIADNVGEVKAGPPPLSDRGQANVLTHSASVPTRSNVDEQSERSTPPRVVDELIDRFCAKRSGPTGGLSELKQLGKSGRDASRVVPIIVTSAHQLLETASSPLSESESYSLFIHVEALRRIASAEGLSVVEKVLERLNESDFVYLNAALAQYAMGGGWTTLSRLLGRGIQADTRDEELVREAFNELSDELKWNLFRERILLATLEVPSVPPQNERLNELADKLERAIGTLQRGLRELSQVVADIRGRGPARGENVEAVAALLDTRIAGIADTVADAVGRKLGSMVRATGRGVALEAKLSANERRALEALDRLSPNSLREAEKELATLVGEPMTEAFTEGFKARLLRHQWGVVCAKCRQPSTLIWKAGAGYAQGGRALFSHTGGEGHSEQHKSLTSVPKFKLCMRPTRRQNSSR
jgi:hypothetical protein